MDEENFDIGTLPEGCLVIGSYYELHDWLHSSAVQLPTFLMENLKQCKQIRPSPNQRFAIPAIFGTNRDIFNQAQTSVLCFKMAVGAYVALAEDPSANQAKKLDRRNGFPAMCSRAP